MVTENISRIMSLSRVIFEDWRLQTAIARTH